MPVAAKSCLIPWLIRLSFVHDNELPCGGNVDNSTKHQFPTCLRSTIYGHNFAATSPPGITSARGLQHRSPVHRRQLFVVETPGRQWRFVPRWPRASASVCDERHVACFECGGRPRCFCWRSPRSRSFQIALGAKSSMRRRTSASNHSTAVHLPPMLRGNVNKFASGCGVTCSAWNLPLAGSRNA